MKQVLIPYAFVVPLYMSKTVNLWFHASNALSYLFLLKTYVH